MGCIIVISCASFIDSNSVERLLGNRHHLIGTDSFSNGHQCLLKSVFSKFLWEARYYFMLDGGNKRKLISMIWRLNEK